jgi:hypothetical protein
VGRTNGKYTERNARAQERYLQKGDYLFLYECGSLTLRVPALYLLFFSFSIFKSFRSAASTDLFRKTMDGPMYSPSRVNKLLAYPRADADNPVIP